MRKPYVNLNRTRTTEDGSVLDIYEAPPFTRNPGPELFLCTLLKRFYFDWNSGTHCWVDDRGVLMRGINVTEKLLDAGHTVDQVPGMLRHIEEHHQVFTVPWKTAHAIFYRHHTIPGVKQPVRVYANENLKHLLT